MIKSKMNSLKDAVIRARIRAYCLKQDLKDDVSGMEVVQVVIILALGVLLVAALWFFLGDFLTEFWERINDADFEDFDTGR